MRILWTFVRWRCMIVFIFIIFTVYKGLTAIKLLWHSLVFNLIIWYVWAQRAYYRCLCYSSHVRLLRRGRDGGSGVAVGAGDSLAARRSVSSAREFCNSPHTDSTRAITSHAHQPRRRAAGGSRHIQSAACVSTLTMYTSIEHAFWLNRYDTDLYQSYKWDWYDEIDEFYIFFPVLCILQMWWWYVVKSYTYLTFLLSRKLSSLSLY